MDYLANYQTFPNKYDLNDAIAMHLAAHGNALNQTERIVLTKLSRYAVKYPGAAHLKISTIAEAVKKSERTVRRSLEKLEHLQIIERQSFYREKKGGYGANLYIFRPYTQAHASIVKSEPKKIQRACTVATTPIHVYEGERVTYYARFTELVQSYSGVGNEKLIRDLYGIYKAKSVPLMKFSIHADKGELFETLAIQAINILFQATKKKKVMNLVGYYDGILRELIDEALFADAFMDYDEPVEFFIPGRR